MHRNLRQGGLQGTGWWRLAVVLMAVAFLPLAACGTDGIDGAAGANGADGADGTDGLDGAPGDAGPPGPAPGAMVNVMTGDPDLLAEMEIEFSIQSVVIASPPVVTFGVFTSSGLPVVGIGAWFDNEDNRIVRWALAKLVPGEQGIAGPKPDHWVRYASDTGREGGALVDNGDGTYVYTFGTDVTDFDVTGVTWEPGLTHRLAGQLGSSSFPFQALNFVHDFVPAGGAVTRNRKIAMTASCNECHVKLTMHGRRYEVDYCVTCHNPELGEDGEANMSYMVHRIHNGGVFADLGDFSEVTYPQDVTNCRKCHNGADTATPQADNWKNLPNRAACDACHDILDTGNHPINANPDDGTCQLCHTPDAIERVHATPNATPNNPNLIKVPDQVVDQRSITYDLVSAAVDPTSGDVTICFNILDSGTPLDLLDLPQDLLDGKNWPSFLLAWAQAQDGIDEPKDYTNTGNDAAQPTSVSISKLDPINTATPVGTLAWDSGLACWVAVLKDASAQFPAGAKLRAVGIQGYMRQDLDGDHAYDVSLHTPSKVVAVTDDDKRREVVDSAKCANCHEWFEGHGGNRVYTIAICTMCHVPNLSSSGRELAPLAALPSGYTENPEDAQNLKDMIHGIHSSAFRTRKYEHVRNRNSGYYYDWSEVTFPAEDGTRDCLLCHKAGTYLLPLDEGLLPTTVRTTGVNGGQDATTADVVIARDAPTHTPTPGTFPNDWDWVNSPVASSCFYCHTSTAALGHMLQNGGLLSVPNGSYYTNRVDYGTPFESCAVCHGEGKIWDVQVVHGE